MAVIEGPGPLTAAFLIREANGMYRSREEGDVRVAAGGTLNPGTILGRITASGLYVRHDPAASNGSQNVAGILFEGISNVGNASQVTVRRTIVVRDCEVHKTELIYSAGADAAAITAADNALRGLGIIPRL